VKFSIVMTVYERETLFPHALYSVLQQTHDDWELIIMADGPHPSVSRDVDLLVSDKYHGRWGRRSLAGRIEYHEKNNVPRGTVGNPLRRAGLELASGDYICFMGHDCVYDKDYLSAHIENIKRAGAACVSLVYVLYWTTYPSMINEVLNGTSHERGIDTNIPMYVGRIPWSKDGRVDVNSIKTGEIDLTCMCFPVIEARQVGAFSLDLDTSYDADYRSFDRLRGVVPVMIHNEVFAGHF
jgi:glycosyltransferase involved in cell wall biosynthesis